MAVTSVRNVKIAIVNNLNLPSRKLSSKNRRLSVGGAVISATNDKRFFGETKFTGYRCFSAVFRF